MEKKNISSEDHLYVGYNIQDVSEIDYQTLRARFTHYKDGKKSYKHGSENASFPNYKYFLFTSGNMLRISNPCSMIDTRHALT